MTPGPEQDSFPTRDRLPALRLVNSAGRANLILLPQAVLRAGLDFKTISQIHSEEKV